MKPFQAGILAAGLLLVGFLSGCAQPPAAAQLVAVTPPPAEMPVANLPEDLRPHNWTDAFGSGSCVNASTVYMLRWRGMMEAANWWRSNHAGGETDGSICHHHYGRLERSLRSDPAGRSWDDCPDGVCPPAAPSQRPWLRPLQPDSWIPDSVAIKPLVNVDFGGQPVAWMAVALLGALVVFAAAAGLILLLKD